MKEYKDKKFLSKVAVLYYIKDLTQQEIAKNLVSQGRRSQDISTGQEKKKL
jgi:DNA-binding transcriptional regulator LsrR (DeoR family)